MTLERIRLWLILATGIATCWAAAFDHDDHPRLSRGLALGASVGLVACYVIGGA